MKINIIGEMSEFYVQTLCLIFFPGSKFSENAVHDSNEPQINVRSIKTDKGYEAFVDIIMASGTFSGHYETPDSTLLTRPSMAEKITVGKALLEAGSKACSFTPPWGVLTGVRPSKLAVKNFDAGMTKEDNIKSLMSDYGVSKAKAELAVNVAEAERVLITEELYGECSVYVAIPFCPSRCSYCSFVSFTSGKLLELIPQYLSVLADEIRKKAALIKALGLKVTTVYIGGGTPTVLSEKQLGFLLDTICDSIDTKALREFTLEAGRPDTITAEKLKIAEEHNVTRISVNTQTLNDRILEAIGRKHTSEDFFRAYEIAKKSGIGNINVDLIAGLPGESAESFMKSIDGVISLDPENITVHTFCVKKSADIRREGPAVYASENKTAEKSVSYSQKTLVDNGYVPYYMYRQKNTMGNLENVGFSKPGHEGLYNVFMMEEIQSIFAVGASAVSKLVHVSKDGTATIERIAENKYPYEYLAEKTSDENNLKIDEYEKKVFDFYKKHFQVN